MARKFGSGMGKDMGTMQYCLGCGTAIGPNGCPHCDITIDRKSFRKGNVTLSQVAPTTFRDATGKEHVAYVYEVEQHGQSNRAGR